MPAFKRTGTSPSVLSGIKLPVAALKQKSAQPWTGPNGAGPQGGISYSLLCRFLTCRERFRVYSLEGLRGNEGFSSAMEYGNIWHAAEEAFAKGEDWQTAIASYCHPLFQRYPLDRTEIIHWYEMAKTFFPIYADFWSKHPDVQTREPIFQEEKFDIPYRLPSGRIVRLRGKWDAVDQIGNEIWIQENKSKSTINQEKINRQLTFDLQTMIYQTALEVGRYDKPLIDYIPKGTKIAGVRYNVIRRPAHKTRKSALEKCELDVRNRRAGEWFSRWQVNVTPHDVNVFRKTCLDPLLENVCYWYEWHTNKNHTTPYGVPAPHWVHPFGVRNVLDEGGFTDLDAYIANGRRIGLGTVTDLFPELNQAV